MISKLVFHPERSDSTSAAAIYWMLDQGKRTLLLDEMDNADLVHNQTLRTVINGGFEPSGVIRRQIQGRTKKFSTFAPMALAAINTHKPIPHPTLSRSIIVPMMRSKKDLKLFDRADTEDLDIVRGQVWLWARPDLKLNKHPDMPKELRRGRPRDKWRVLFAIADHFGAHWGERARAAALIFAAARRDQDEGVQLLEDTRLVFNSPPVDRMFSKVLIDRLRALPDADWGEPLPLTQTRFAQIVQAFDPKLKAKPLWSKGGRRRGPSEGLLQGAIPGCMGRLLRGRRHFRRKYL